MRGIVHIGDGVADITNDLEVRGPKAHEVVVRVVNAGVCHSDLSVLDGTIAFPTPCVMGHEGAGVVEEVGSAVTSVEIGDHVVISTVANCGRCPACAAGHPTHCGESIGKFRAGYTYNGETAYAFATAACFAERTVVEAIQAVKISKDVPLSSACLIGCGVITGMGSVLNRARVQVGETAAVFGVGGVGLNAIQALRLSGASRIIAVDTVPEKAALAEKFGATDFINPLEVESTAQAIKDLLPKPGSMFAPGGVDWSFECTGVPAVLIDALGCLHWGGNAVAVGVPKPTATLEVPIMGNFIYIDKGLMGCRYGSARPHHDFPMIADLYSQGKVLLDELVSSISPMAEFKSVIEQMHTGKLARAVLSI